MGSTPILDERKQVLFPSCEPWVQVPPPNPNKVEMQARWLSRTGQEKAKAFFFVEKFFQKGVDKLREVCYTNNVERDKSPRREREETTMKNTENKITMTNEQFRFLLNHLYELAKDRGLTDAEILHELADKMEEMVAQGYRVEG